MAICMANSHIFISYKHGDPSTRIAKALYDYLDAVSDALKFEIFMDDERSLSSKMSHFQL